MNYPVFVLRVLFIFSDNTLRLFLQFISQILIIYINSLFKKIDQRTPREQKNREASIASTFTITAKHIHTRYSFLLHAKQLLETAHVTKYVINLRHNF
jgi:ABC-type multidrug transport system fused ATPase/permease subunit